MREVDYIKKFNVTRDDEEKVSKTNHSDEENEDELQIDEPGHEKIKASPQKKSLLERLRERKADLDNNKELQDAQPQQKNTEDENKPLTFEEKNHINDRLSKLDSFKLARVLIMIEAKAPSAFKKTEEDIDVDLDKIDNFTLRIIENYLTTQDASSLLPTSNDADTGRGKRKKKQTEKSQQSTPSGVKKQTSGTPKKKKKDSVPKAATKILKEWLAEHPDATTPTSEQKEELATKTGLNASKITQWFLNKSKPKKQKTKKSEAERMADMDDTVAAAIAASLNKQEEEEEEEKEDIPIW
ncbi:hypothetical protein AKO1_009029 [Acrasis kona]|uniref:Homeobox domain-containing protein n=1 Tax=Acrasis kona TaxID=1008807 RepID=A0AAW2ZGT0_9EUKA